MTFFATRGREHRLEEVLLTADCVNEWNRWLRAEERLLSNAAGIIEPYIKLTVEQFEARTLAKALKFSYSIEWAPPAGDERVLSFPRGNNRQGWLIADPNSIEVLKHLGPWVLGFNVTEKQLFVYPFKEKAIRLKAVRPFQVKK